MAMAPMEHDNEIIVVKMAPASNILPISIPAYGSAYAAFNTQSGTSYDLTKYDCIGIAGFTTGSNDGIFRSINITPSGNSFIINRAASAISLSAPAIWYTYKKK